MSDFWKDSHAKDGYKFNCRDCSIVKSRANYQVNRVARIKSSTEWKKRNPERAKAQIDNYRASLRAKIISGYGGKCECCGEREIAFLTLEHKNGGGCKHRAKTGSLGVYRQVVQRGFPDEFTVLCMNCNFARRFRKTCPHRTILAKAKA